MRLTRMMAVVALAAVLPALPAELSAQSSLFGVRGLGQPGRPLTPRTRGTGGSFGLFDGESDINPAAMANLRSVTADFVIAPTWRTWETPAGNASLRDTRFPLLFIGGPIPGKKVALGVSLGSYADRDFRLATRDSILVRGVQTTVFDSLKSVGGINEIRFAAGYALSPRTSVGGAVYWITGSSRLEARRSFSDTSFIAFRQTAELSYQGVGFALGITQRLGSAVQLAASVRSDGHVTVDKDSTRAYSVNLPYTLGAGVMLRASPKLSVAASGSYRTWGDANGDLIAQGGVGARNTVELSLGGEYARDPRRPSKLPIRLGVRYADLPFPIVTGQKPKEFSISAGSGLRFAQDRAGIDLALEHAWRSEGSAYKERAFMLTFGLSIRPYGDPQR